MDKELNISEVFIHPQNPRELSDFMEEKLCENILVFPQMLSSRPMVINRNNLLLRGNQRVTCLRRIKEMSEDELKEAMENQRNYRMMEPEKQQELLDYWIAWQSNPLILVRIAGDLSPEEELQFMIKDNIHFGEDDVDVLRKNFDRDTIKDMVGVIPWNMYSYDEHKINDAEVETPRVVHQVFKCGYVSVSVTDEEMGMLQSSLEEWQKKTGGSSDGFLSFLLGMDYEIPEDNSPEDYIPKGGYIEYEEDDNENLDLPV